MAKGKHGGFRAEVLLSPAEAEKVAGIIVEMVNGKTLKQCCEDAGENYLTTWQRIHSEKNPALKKAYDSARIDYIHKRVQDMEDIARDTSLEVGRAKLMIDAIKWTASKVAPKEYGDRQAIEHGGRVESRINYVADMPKRGE